MYHFIIFESIFATILRHNQYDTNLFFNIDTRSNVLFREAGQESQKKKINNSFHSCQTSDRYSLSNLEYTYVTTGQTHRRTDRRMDGQTDRQDGQSDLYVPLCFAGDTKSCLHPLY